jgi:hypothetical protein
MELLPSVFTKRKTGRKRLRKINKSSARNRSSSSGIRAMPSKFGE